LYGGLIGDGTEFCATVTAWIEISKCPVVKKNYSTHLDKF